ncbi:MAG: glycosyltransferase family 39 protein [Chloroflexi bacterium]|nr:glycosyltransferase family 39 protein [Chloroflexota bacterium]
MSEIKGSFFKREKYLFWTFFAVYFILGLVFVFLSKFWTDENWYLGGSWLIANGEVPFRDFFSHHNPLQLYVYAVPQYLFGPSLIVGRLTSLLFMMLNFVLVWRLARKLGGRTSALIAGGLLISNLFVIYYFTTLSYRVLEVFLMLVFFTVLLGDWKDSIKYPLAVLPISLVVGIRYPIDFVSGLLVLYLAFVAYRNWQKKRVVLISLSVAGLSLGLIMLPFIVMARDQFFFSTVAFNFLTPSYWVDFGITSPPGIIDRIYHLLTIQSGVFQNFYAVAAILFALLFYLISKVVTGKVNIKELAAKNQNLVFLLIFIVLYEMFCLAAPQSTVSLRVFSLGVTAIVAGVGLARVMAAIKDKSATLLLYGLIIGLIILTPFAQYAQGNEARPTLTWQKTEMKYISDVANKVAGHTEEGDRILTFTPVFAIQAGRELMPGTTM